AANGNLCCFHSGSPPREAGCSHQPPASRTSILPSPFTSPKPSPCVYLCQLPLGEILWKVQGLAGSLLYGLTYPKYPPELQLISGLMSPVRSPLVGYVISTMSNS